MKAIWNEKIIAESDATIIVEGSHYFPKDAVQDMYLQASETHTTCGWKGIANYYHVVADGHINTDAAWYYPKVKEAAKEIEGYVAFWRGVEITE